MPEETPRSSPIRLEGYTLESDRPQTRGLATPADDPASLLPLRITLRGQSFIIASMDPKIMIGDLEVTDFEILSDQRTIVAYLHQIPEEGATISIDYGRGASAEMPEGFSLAKLQESGSSD